MFIRTTFASILSLGFVIAAFGWTGAPSSDAAAQSAVCCVSDCCEPGALCCELALECCETGACCPASPCCDGEQPCCLAGEPCCDDGDSCGDGACCAVAAEV